MLDMNSFTEYLVLLVSNINSMRCIKLDHSIVYK